MAGHGPAPKAPGQRRRRNVPERGEWVDLPRVTGPVLDELKAMSPAPWESWHPRIEALWSAWRQDPASTQWGPAEVAAVVELAYLMQEFAAGSESERKYDRVSASELRLRMDGLGLTAKGKRDLRWRAPSEHAAEVETARPQLAEVRRIHAVDPSAA